MIGVRLEIMLKERVGSVCMVRRSSESRSV
jgi:hypothetical protein